MNQTNAPDYFVYGNRVYYINDSTLIGIDKWKVGVGNRTVEELRKTKNGSYFLSGTVYGVNILNGKTEVKERFFRPVGKDQVMFHYLKCKKKIVQDSEVIKDLGLEEA